MPFVLPVALELPAIYTKFIDGFSVLNISQLLRFFRFDCMTRIDHYDQVLMMTLGPIIVAALTFIAVRTSGGRQARESFFNFFLLGTFFIYPSTSTVLFQTFRCEAFRAPTTEGDDYVESYLRADLRLACASGSNRERARLAPRRPMAISGQCFCPSYKIVSRSWCARGA